MIFIHRYELIRKKTANSQTQNLTQAGALLKVTDSDNHFGVADICPWPSLGDLNLEQEILQKGPLFQRAVELAKKDLQARKNKMNLISNIQLKNHILVPEYKNFDFKSVAGSVVKIKGDLKITELANTLNKITDVRIRLDFNFCLTEIEFRTFLDLLKPETLKNIDVVEDPFEFNFKSWTELNQKITLALDWNPHHHQWKNLICKPARGLTKFFLYMTSVMDHPVGVAHGIAIAQNYPEMTHGFLTNELYTDTEFNESTGFGIGYEKQLSDIVWEPLIDWSENSPNHLMLSQKSSTEEKNILSEMFEKFNQEISANNYFLIPSSGSSQSIHQSVKLIALKKSAVLNSALRVNQQFEFTEQMNWGCVLPTHHVGGLGILARSHLSGAKVCFHDWKKLMAAGITEWIIHNKIQIVSLVPAQIYDLVQKNIECPQMLKTVFVGGSELSLDLAKQANQLRWPVVQTYGMTESASMVAFKEDHKNNFFELMNGVQIQDSNLMCNSIASYSIQKSNNDIQITKYSDSIQLSDQIQVSGNQIQFLGRMDDLIQISSETVSMLELRSKLESVLIEYSLQADDFALVAIPDQRSEKQIVLVCLVDSPIVIQKFNSIVRPYEKIMDQYLVKKIPRTDLGKIKYGELAELIFSFE